MEAFSFAEPAFPTYPGATSAPARSALGRRAGTDGQPVLHRSTGAGNQKK